MVTVAESLETNNKLQKIGGISYLTELSRNTHSIHNIVAYADIVRECSNLRNLIRISKKNSRRSF